MQAWRAGGEASRHHPLDAFLKSYTRLNLVDTTKQSDLLFTQFDLYLESHALLATTLEQSTHSFTRGYGRVKVVEHE